MTLEPAPLFCANHPNIETTLRCNRCEKPICTKCAVRTPTGYRCIDCVRGQQKVFNTAIWFDYILASLIALILAFIGSRIATLIGFFALFVAPIAGGIIAEAIRLAVRRRRSKSLFQASAGAAALGSLIPVMLSFLTGFLGLSLIWQIVFTIILTSTVYYRLSGIRL